MILQYSSIVSILLLVLGFHIASAQSIQWQKHFGGSASDEARAALQTPDGGYILAGSTSTFKGKPDATTSAYLVKTDADGNVEWEKVISYDKVTVVTAMIPDEYGYALIGHTSGEGLGSDLYFARVDLGGNVLWHTTYSTLGDQYATAAIRSNDSGIAITGFSDENIMVAKLDSAGSFQWGESYGGANVDRGYGIDQTPNGQYIITGFTQSSPAIGRDAFLLRVSRNGDSLWMHLIGTSANEEGVAVEQTGDGHILLVARGGVDRPDIYVVILSEDGVIQASRHYGDANDNVYPYSMSRLSDGSYIIAGTRGRTALYLLNVTASGVKQWDRIIEGPSRELNPYSIRQTADDGFIISGSSFTQETSYNAFVMKVSNRASGIDQLDLLPATLDLSHHAK